MKIITIEGFIRGVMSDTAFVAYPGQQYELGHDDSGALYAELKPATQGVRRQVAQLEGDNDLIEYHTIQAGCRLLGADGTERPWPVEPTDTMIPEMITAAARGFFSMLAALSAQRLAYYLALSRSVSELNPTDEETEALNA